MSIEHLADLGKIAHLHHYMEATPESSSRLPTDFMMYELVLAVFGAVSVDCGGGSEEIRDLMHKLGMPMMEDERVKVEGDDEKS